MEILSPSPPPPPSPYPALDDQRRLRCGGRREQHRGEAWVHVAVGRSPEKTLGLLRWVIRRFGCGRLVLLHVHQSSPLIPTLLGKIPAGQATEEVVISHRKSEKEEMNRVLLGYLAFCHRAQVQATLLVTENDQVHDGILTLVNRYEITKLVMGSTPDSCFKLKASYGKESLMARNAPAFCEIWFVWRGRHIWTREASTATDKNIATRNQDDVMTAKRIRFSSCSSIPVSILDGGYVTYETSTMVHLNQGAVSDDDRSNEYEGLASHETNHFYDMSIANWQDPESELSSTFWSDSSVQMETFQLYSKQILDRNIKQIIMEAEGSRKEAFVELLKRKETESKVTSAFSRAKASDSAEKHEIKKRGELEMLLAAARKQHEELIKNKEKAESGLDASMRRLAILDARTKKVSLWMDEAAAELEVIQSSIQTLKQQKLNIQKGWTYNHDTFPNWISFALGDGPYSFKELKLSDIESATCKFSESFKIRSQGNGSIYKGEIMNRRVMVHNLNLRGVQSVRQFQQEVYILSKVRHPHVATLIGACSEALCLVYEYLSNGSLHDCLFSKHSSPRLPWKIRARIVAEISSALLFLHSCKPQIIHGDLKLENILLDTDFHCKIANFGLSQTLMDDTSFCGDSELNGSFPYADPEYQSTEVLTLNSDIYYFGIVILQLLTGKRESVGLAGEVRNAMSCGKLSSMLDETAGEWPMEVAGRLAEFGIRCCETHSQDHQLTPGTVRDLEQLHLMRERRVPSFFLCPILKEIMHDPQVCADGFTYEGRAIRALMENGMETSPVMNQKLEHRNLTPNHAVRIAIQDWLCRAP
ncbi:hypothetical protein ACP4OV_007273 [Aristida adscensionis]